MGFGFLGLLDAGQGVEGADGVADHGDGRPGVPHIPSFGMNGY